ncbi:peptidoglycan-binding protein [Nisaea sp.]|uniref:peptidoglycan-binding protein n=1 Tax=Nisaea sp. TaxID=2024842 RepID=UPI003B52654F
MARKATTWSVKGIEEDVRDIARTAAEREEQTIGAWIDYAIRVHGGQRPRDGRPDSEPAVTDPEALPAPGPAPVAPGSSNADALLDIVDDELDASSSRLDDALRPMGLALLDLAERMVALERSAPAQSRIGPVPERDPDAEAEFDDDFGPEAPPVAEAEAPWPEQYPYPSADPGLPAPPVHDLDPGLDSLDMPLLSGSEGAGSDRAREIDRRLRALAGAVDAVESDPPPPTGDLGPTEYDLEPPSGTPAEAEPLELPMAFRGVQKSGYESHPGAGAEEARRSTARTRRPSRRRLVLAVAAVVLFTAAGFYAMADRVGLGQIRAEIERNVRPAMRMATTEASDVLESLTEQLEPVLSRARTALFGGDKPEQPGQAADHPGTRGQAPAPETAGPESTKISPEVEQEWPQTGLAPAEEEPGAAPAHTAPSASAGTASQNAARPVEDPAPKSAPRPVPAAPAEIEVAPEPKETEPVLVPEAAPAKTVTEVVPSPAPPPAPPMPAPPDGSAGGAESDSQVAALPPEAGGASESVREALAQRAEAGDATAQHDLAIAFLTGKDGPKDVARAAELLREAAIQGLASAQYNLAVLYETGQGVRKDDVRALLWYHSAAEQGHPNAQYNLGVMYAEGRGIPLNFEEAARWFRAAANQGLARALYNLAIMTDEGLGVAQDKAAALELYRAAAGAGDDRAIELLAGSGDIASEPATPLGGAEGVQTVTTTPASLVAETQGELTRLGFYDGRLDGLMGPKTRSAIRAFQESAEIPQSGEASPELLKRLKAATP